MLHKTEFTCYQCGKHITHESEISTGYALDKDDNKICFNCCGENDAKELTNSKIGEKHIFYFSKGEVTNWPGTLKIPIGYVRTGRHNIAGKRYDFWFKYAGNQFHGTVFGDNTEIAHIKHIKLS